MRIDIVFPFGPPALNGIGDHSAILSQRLAQRSHDVRFLTGSSVGHIEGVDVVPVLGEGPYRAVHRLTSSIASGHPDWVILAFEQFAFGSLGFNPLLPFVVRRVARRSNVALIAHERYTSPLDAKRTVFWSYQLPQYRALESSVAAYFTPIPMWLEDFGRRHPSRPASLLPIPSNLAETGKSKEGARAALGLSEADLVIGLFGSLGPDKDLPLTRACLEQAAQDTPGTAVVYAGKWPGVFDDLCADLDLLAVNLGPTRADRVSELLRASDIGLALFTEGVSARRSSFLAGLQHALPTLTTQGEITDEALRQAVGSGAFVAVPRGDASVARREIAELLTNRDRRDKMSTSGRDYYRSRHDWPQITRTIEDTLEQARRPTRS